VSRVRSQVPPTRARSGRPRRRLRPRPLCLNLSPTPSQTHSGYDLGITGGITTSPPFLQSFFPAVSARQAAAAASAPPTDDPAAAAYCKFDDPLLTFFTSSAFLAAAVASLFAGGLSRRAGRRATLLAAGVAFLLGTALTAGAVHVAMLVAGRVLLGAGIGLANAAAPTFLAEVAPTRARAACGAMFQLGTTFAVLFSQVVNLLVLDSGGGSAPDRPPSAWARHAWRLAIGLAFLPAVGLTVGAALCSDSPASLAWRGHRHAARAALVRLRGGEGAGVEEEWAAISQAAQAAAAPSPSTTAAAATTAPWALPFTRALRPELVVASGIAAGSQLGGINAILFYVAPTAASLGASPRGALGAAVAVGAALFLGTFVSIFTADRLGRRVLLLQGGVQMLVCEVALAALLAAFSGPKAGRGATLPGAPPLPPGAAAAALALMCLFVLGFSWSWGPLGWVIPAEVWPLEARPAGQALTTALNFFIVFVVTQVRERGEKRWRETERKEKEEGGVNGAHLFPILTPPLPSPLSPRPFWPACARCSGASTCCSRDS